jgi:hypothetical protein
MTRDKDTTRTDRPSVIGIGMGRLGRMRTRMRRLRIGDD